ncbi:MAG: tetratricopeptide repeat protein [Pseudomonadota bacterium]
MAFALLIAAVLMLAGAGTASGQTDEAPVPQPPADAVEPDVEQDRGDETNGRETVETSAETLHMDALFDQLGRADNPNWESVQAQIWAAWSQSGSDSMDLLLTRAVSAMEKEDYPTALLYLNDLTRLAPDFAEGWNKRATVFFLQRRYGPSVADIQKVLSLEPRHFGALSGLGIILDRTGDKAGALTAYRRVIELHPNMEAAKTAIDRLSPEVDGREL